MLAAPVVLYLRTTSISRAGALRACCHQVLRELREATAEEHAGRERNQVAPEQGRFLAWLVEALGVRSAIEIGVFTGYSSLAVALASPRPFCSTSTNSAC